MSWNSQYVIEAHNVTKSFKGGVVAVNALDVEVPKGSVYGLIGRNGAGKTTTLRILMGLLRADCGEATVLGYDMWEAPRAIRQRIGYVSQSQQLPGWMTLDELCRCQAIFYPRWDGGLADTMARRWEIPRKRPISHLSGGEQRQAAILLALAARPEVLFLDEPAAGLDPVARRGLLTSLVDSLSQDIGCTIMFSTHHIGDLERIGDHIGMMDRGRIVKSLHLNEWLERMRRVQVVFSTERVPDGFTIPTARKIRCEGPVATAVVELANEEQLAPLRAIIGARVNVFPMNLEEIFIEWFDKASDHKECEEVETATEVLHFG